MFGIMCVYIFYCKEYFSIYISIKYVFRVYTKKLGNNPNQP